MAPMKIYKFKLIRNLCQVICVLQKKDESCYVLFGNEYVMKMDWFSQLDKTAVTRKFHSLRLLEYDNILLVNSGRINFVLSATLSLFVLGYTYQRRMFTFRRHAQTFEFKTLCFNNSTFTWTTHPRLKKDSNRRILILILLPNK